MNYSELLTILAAIANIKFYSVYASEGTAMPYGVINYGASENMQADNKNFYPQQNITLEIYTQYKNDALYAAIETELDKNEIVYETDETADDGEQFYIKYYYLLWR